MNSRNTHLQSNEKSKPVNIVAAADNVRVIRSSLPGPEVLALSEDDMGRDPYNSTGQHVIIKMKSASQD